MIFLNRNKVNYKKTVLVISDLHLSAGLAIDGKKNPLEDFHSDHELIDFLDYYSQGEYQNKEVELIINGDFLDFLAVPYVKYFDDEFWSQKAAKDKLKLIYQAHVEVFEALERFLESKNKKVVYIIGNHDAELILSEVRDQFISYFSESAGLKITLSSNLETYIPVKGVFIKHGHQYEVAHNFDPQNSIITSSDGRQYLNPSWGSYYVINVINKYKEERDYVNQIRPIRNFLIHGLIFDPLFTIRFMLANVYYFFMVRVRHLLGEGNFVLNLLEKAKEELELFRDFEELTRDFFESEKTARVLIVGHTHHPSFRSFDNGNVFINTGTWTKMTSLNLSNLGTRTQLTYAKIEVVEPSYKLEDFDKNVNVNLYEWRGSSNLPYEHFY